MKLQFLSVVVLHDDPVATPGDGLDPPETSWQQLHVSTERYFGSIFSLLGTVGTDPDDLIAMRQKITDACPYDHIRYVSLGVLYSTLQFYKCLLSVVDLFLHHHF